MTSLDAPDLALVLNELMAKNAKNEIAGWEYHVDQVVGLAEPYGTIDTCAKATLTLIFDMNSTTIPTRDERGRVTDFTLATMTDNQRKSEPWFLLYDGASMDGYGPGTYIGRTTDPEQALKHFRKIEKNYRSTGGVVIITDDKEYTAWRELDFQEGK